MYNTICLFVIILKYLLKFMTFCLDVYHLLKLNSLRSVCYSLKSFQFYVFKYFQFIFFNFISSLNYFQLDSMFWILRRHTREFQFHSSDRKNFVRAKTIDRIMYKLIKILQISLRVCEYFNQLVQRVRFKFRRSNTVLLY